MTKNKKVLVLGVSSFLAFGAIASISYQSANYSKAAECDHSHVEHYVGVAPTGEAQGKLEHWACCDCGKAFLDADKTMVIEAADRGELMLAKRSSFQNVDVKDVEGLAITDIAATADKIKGADQSTSCTPKDVDDPLKEATWTSSPQYVLIDGRLAARVSTIDTAGVRDNQKYNYGYTEWRFTPAGLTNIKYVSFDYKLWDISGQAEKFNSEPHQFAKLSGAKVGGQANVAIGLENDNEWHTKTFVFDDAGSLTKLQMAIQHFNGEIFISNLKYETEAQHTSSTKAATIYQASSWSALNGGTAICTDNSISISATWQAEVAAAALTSMKADGQYLAFDFVARAANNEYPFYAAAIMNNLSHQSALNIDINEQKHVVLDLNSYDALGIQVLAKRDAAFIVNSPGNVTITNAQFVEKADYDAFVASNNAVDFDNVATKYSEFCKVFYNRTQIYFGGVDGSDAIVSYPDGLVGIKNSFLQYLRDNKYKSFSFDFVVPAESTIKTLCAVATKIAGGGEYAYVFKADNNGVISVVLDEKAINNYSALYFVCRNADGYSQNPATNIGYANAKIRNVSASKYALVNAGSQYIYYSVLEEGDNFVTFNINNLANNYKRVLIDAADLAKAGYDGCVINMKGNTNRGYIYANSVTDNMPTGYAYSADKRLNPNGVGQAVAFDETNHYVGFMTCTEIAGNSSDNNVTVSFYFYKTSDANMCKEALETIYEGTFAMGAFNSAVLNLMRQAGVNKFKAHFDPYALSASKCSDYTNMRLVFVFTGCTGISVVWAQLNNVTSAGVDWNIDLSSFLNAGASGSSFNVRCWHASTQNIEGHNNEGSGCWKNIDTECMVSNVTFAE